MLVLVLCNWFVAATISNPETTLWSHCTNFSFLSLATFQIRLKGISNDRSDSSYVSDHIIHFQCEIICEIRHITRVGSHWTSNSILCSPHCKNAPWIRKLSTGCWAFSPQVNFRRISKSHWISQPFAYAYVFLFSHCLFPFFPFHSGLLYRTIDHLGPLFLPGLSVPYSRCFGSGSLYLRTLKLLPVPLPLPLCFVSVTLHVCFLFPICWNGVHEVPGLPMCSI